MSEFLDVRGARTHNLKNIHVKIPKNKMVIITGLSGSGKSSLAFSTIYNLGQQKYLESLSSYARMFIGNTSEPDVDEIIGLSPTISIDQKSTNNNPRSTVGTITEIYDYYKVLFLNAGERFCVKCGNKIKKDTTGSVVKEISNFPLDTKFVILAKTDDTFYDLSTAEKIKKNVLDAGFIRFFLGETLYTVNDDIEEKDIHKELFYVVDRLTVGNYDIIENRKRLLDSLDLAFNTANGTIDIIFYGEKTHRLSFNNKFVCSSCGHIPSELTISSFSFNSHKGACPDCHGLGEKMVFIEDDMVNPKLTLSEGAVIPPGFGTYFIQLLQVVGKKNKIRLNVPYENLTVKEKKIVMYGTGEIVYTFPFVSEKGNTRTYKSKFEGVIPIITRRYYEGGDKQNRYEDFLRNTVCETCKGHRLTQESLSVKIAGKNIGEISDMSVEASRDFFKNLKLSENDMKIVNRVRKNIEERLEFLEGVGLGYMTISRKAGTLSGGEAQRIRLATQIGVKLEGIIYVLDEPSIGLHPRDNDMLIENLKKLRDIGNTLIVVEHDEDIMFASDYIIDIGPGAGIHGGNIVAQGSVKEIMDNGHSITAPYLSKKKTIEIQHKKRNQKKFLEIFGASHNNLKNIDVRFPVQNLTVVTGVSGSGKSSLINDTLAPYLLNKLNNAKQAVGNFRDIKGLEYFDKALVIDQSPIGRTPRSNPATYTGVFTHIREVFSQTYEAKIRGYNAGRFSFNTKHGRCNDCDGEGVKKIEMHFMAPVFTTCETCNGTRYKPEVLEVRYKGKNIADVLDLTIEEAYDFFSSHPKIKKILKVLMEVGLGYMKLGQSSTTVSGGEAQRIRLSTELAKRSTSKTIYVLDEPTTGLHFQDVEKLLMILHGLVDKGNTVIVIEHNMNVILNADYLIDIGPLGGDNGGKLIYSGDIIGIQKNKKSHTGIAIKKYLEPR